MSSDNFHGQTPWGGTMHPNQLRHVRLLITIVDRGKGQTVVDLLTRDRVLFHRIALGRGTAKTEILNLLGLGETAKDVVFSVLHEFKAHRAMHRLRNTLQFDNPGHGISFSIRIGSIGGHRALHLLEEDEADGQAEGWAGKETHMEAEDKQFDLIIAMVENGYADQVMDAARPAGAQGGTVLHARGAGIREAEKFFGITIQPEKEMVFILAKHESKRAIMEAIFKEAGLSTPGHGLVLSLPAEDVMGVARLLRDDDEEKE